jgi:hypothetical protein
MTMGLTLLGALITSYGRKRKSSAIRLRCGSPESLTEKAVSDFSGL